MPTSDWNAQLLNSKYKVEVSGIPNHPLGTLGKNVSYQLMLSSCSGQLLTEEILDDGTVVQPFLEISNCTSICGFQTEMTRRMVIQNFKRRFAQSRMPVSVVPIFS
jgi:hypothetical protein